MKVRHCRRCDGDGIDPDVKTDEGKVAPGEYAVACSECDGTGHIVEEDEE